MKALKMSRSVKGLYEKVQSCLSADSLQKLFKLLPPNSCSGLIPSIRKALSLGCYQRRKLADLLTRPPNRPRVSRSTQAPCPRGRRPSPAQ